MIDPETMGLLREAVYDELVLFDPRDGHGAGHQMEYIDVRLVDGRVDVALRDGSVMQHVFYGRDGEIMPALRAAAQRCYDKLPPKAVAALIFDLALNDDAEITCIYCRDARTVDAGRVPCEFGIRFRDSRSTLWAGIHATCLDVFRGRSGARAEES